MNPFILTRDEDRKVLRLDLGQETSQKSKEMFDNAVEKFEAHIDEWIDFDPGYKLQDDECFIIRQFEVPQALISACEQPLSAERVSANEFRDLSVYSIVGFNCDNGKRRLYFQNFDSRRVLVPGERLAIWSMEDTSTFNELGGPVVILDSQLAAIWDSGNLFFKSFHLANRIFNLSHYFTEATDEQLEAFTRLAQLTCANVSGFVEACSQTSRKKIALILRSGILDEVTTKDLLDAAKSVNYNIKMDGSQIVIPDDKSELKSLLQFLDEDLYLGPLSQKRFLSSGKRPLP